MDAQDLRKKILDYHTGRLTATEKTELLRQLNSLSAAEREELFPQEEWEALQPYPVTAKELKTVLGEIKRRSLERERSGKDVPQAIGGVRPGSGRIFRLAGKDASRWLQAACVLGVIILSGVIVMKLRISVPDIKQNISSVIHYRDIRVADGRRTTIRMSDGTLVTVNGGSLLSIPEPFSGAGREVFLKEGEAWFEVAKDPRRPFVVHSSHMNIQVLGTSFSVRDYEDEKNADVSLSTGKVAVSLSATQSAPVYLLPGGQVSLNKESSSFTQRSLDPAVADAWIRGDLVFQSVTLHHVLNVLRHRYAVSFDVKRPDLEEEKFSATFRNYNIETIMQQLHLMSGIQYKIEGTKIYIR